jgi:hypothetical protein
MFAAPVGMSSRARQRRHIARLRIAGFLNWLNA